MDGKIFDAIGQAFDFVKSIGTGIINLLSKDKVDKTELAKMKHEYEMAVQQLDFSLKQAQLWMQEKLIALEQATGARWRTPLILTSGIALILAAFNNILAACYFEWAHPVDMTSAPMAVLGGMFVLLVVGDAKLLMEVFNGRNKPPGDNNSPAKKEGE